MEIPDTLVRPGTRDVKSPLDALSFDLIGRNLYAEALPSVLEFNFGALNEKQKKVLRITNIHSSAARVTVLPPSSPAFEIFVRKKGSLAPGIAEEVIVTFKPTEWTYYTDSIKVMTLGGSHLLVPIRGIPSTPSLEIPRFIDFGNVPINETAMRYVNLENKIPIDYSYKAKALTYTPDLVVEPIDGTVPGNSSGSITLSFTPVCFTTLSASFELSFSNSSAVKRFTVMGSCQPPTLIPPTDPPPPIDVETTHAREVWVRKSSPRPATPKIQMKAEDSDALKEIFFEQSIFGPVKKMQDLKSAKISRCVGEAEPSQAEVAAIAEERAAALAAVRQLKIEKALSLRNGANYSETPVLAPKEVQVKLGGAIPMRASFKVRLRLFETVTRTVAIVMTRYRASKRLKRLKANLKFPN